MLTFAAIAFAVVNGAVAYVGIELVLLFVRLTPTGALLWCGYLLFLTTAIATDEVSASDHLLNCLPTEIASECLVQARSRQR
ncbi:hypothetical protein KR51_00000290 [Rubidibacter lacunae KORDI 51-2]|uniref:Uncharacterized protein n=1 Tax=Rubidibacter lacunae KORDI 51-2 TaxID=582515 RepID=U5DRA7_9CHRO|nr:hypothetical protein [Rubidibacter lacunae]ERN43139.1 hypothetical protein KR51_00000290 [Rubidibacter lacunae KORDI 51-2]